MIGRFDAILMLVSLFLESDRFHAKKYTSIELCLSCIVKENNLRAIKVGIMKVLVKLTTKFKLNMVDKSLAASLVGDGREAS